MRLFRVTWVNGSDHFVAPTKEHLIDSFNTQNYNPLSVVEVKLEGELVPLPTLEQLVKMGIAERWNG